MTTTVIDQLIVVLGLDPDDFSDGRKKVAEEYRKLKEEQLAAGKEVEKRAQAMSDFFAKLRGQVILLIGAIAGAHTIHDFFTGLISGTASLGYFSRTVGESTTEISAWAQAAEQMGGSGDDMKSSIASLSGELQQFLLTGESNVIPFFRSLGINIEDANGHLKTSTQLWLEVAQRVQGMDPQRATALMRGLGASDSMINFLLQGPGAVRAQLEAQRRLAPTADDIKQAQELQRSWREIQQMFTKLVREELPRLMPYIREFVHWLKEGIDYLMKHPDAANAFFDALGILLLATTAKVLGLTAAVRGFFSLLGFGGGAAAAGGAGAFGSLLGPLGAMAGTFWWLDNYGVNAKWNDTVRNTPAGQWDRSASPSGYRPPGFDRGIEYGVRSRLPSGLRQMMEDTDRRLGLPKGSTAAQLWVESRLNPSARSGAGAMGLAQIMPATLAAMNKRFGRQMNPYDPVDAILMNREIMRENLAHFGNYNDALMAYNGGWDRSHWANAETMLYPGKVLSARGGIGMPRMGAGVSSSSHTTSVRSSSSQVSVGEINVYPKDSSVGEITSGIRNSLSQRLSAAQSNLGLQ